MLSVMHPPALHSCCDAVQQCGHKGVGSSVVAVTNGLFNKGSNRLAAMAATQSVCDLTAFIFTTQGVYHGELRSVVLVQP